MEHGGDVVRIGTAPLDVLSAVEAAGDPGAGGTAVFIGTTRDRFEGAGRATGDGVPDLGGVSYGALADARAAVATAAGGGAGSAGRTVLTLVYEAYEPMALQELRKVGAEARARWALHRLVLLHRLGEVPVGAASVVVVASSEHRRDALDAVAFCIDRLKATVPIWKKEVYADGTTWKANAEALRPLPAAAAPTAIVDRAASAATAAATNDPAAIAPSAAS